MIYTRFGTEVEIVGATYTVSGEVDYVTIRYDDGEEREVEVYELRADDGMDEIMETVIALGQ